MVFATPSVISIARMANISYIPDVLITADAEHSAKRIQEMSEHQPADSNKQTLRETLSSASPRLHKLDLVRTRLVQHLNEAQSRNLTILAAPQGFGKTTLLGHWAAQGDHKISWLNLTRHDNDPGRFMKALIHALQRINPAIGKDVFAMLYADQKPSMEAVLKRLIDDIAMTLYDFYIVLEDYDRIQSQAIHNIIEYILHYVPAQMHLVISCQADPPLDLAGLRSYGRLKEIRTPYLAFTTDEAGAFFNNTLDLNMSVGDISAIMQCSSGHPTAIKCTGLCLQEHPDRTAFISAYEADSGERWALPLREFLEQQPAATREALRILSISEYISNDLYETIREPYFPTLEELADTAVFVAHVNNQLSLYRYYSLVRRYVRSVSEMPESSIYTATAQWYLAQGEVDNGIEFLLLAGDMETAAAQIEVIAQDRLQNSEMVTVMSWLEQLPDDIIEQRPLLSICQAWIQIIRQDLTGIEKHLENAMIRHQEAANPGEIIEHIAAIRDFLKSRLQQR